MNEQEEANAAWSRQHHAMMKPGGIWGVPRSGLMMRKTEAGFELYEVMPFMVEMGGLALMGVSVPGTEEELKRWQREDFACIKRHFEMAGLSVTDPKGLLK